MLPPLELNFKQRYIVVDIMFKSLKFKQDLPVRWNLIVILTIQGVIWRLCEIASASSAFNFQHHWQEDKK